MWHRIRLYFVCTVIRCPRQEAICRIQMGVMGGHSGFDSRMYRNAPIAHKRIDTVYSVLPLRRNSRRGWVRGNAGNFTVSGIAVIYFVGDEM